MSLDYPDKERRKHIRIYKNFILSYCEKNLPSEKYEISQLKNISKGGMCFIATRALANGAEVCIELKTPYIADSVFLEGTVLESHEKILQLLYEVRLEFKDVSPQAMSVLERIEQYG
jgi:hypothetical protein